MISLESSDFIVDQDCVCRFCYLVSSCHHIFPFKQYLQHIASFDGHVPVVFIVISLVVMLPLFFYFTGLLL